MAISQSQRDYALDLLRKNYNQHIDEFHKKTKWSAEDERLYNANLTKDDVAKVRDFLNSADKGLPTFVLVDRRVFGKKVKSYFYDEDLVAIARPFMEEVNAYHKAVAEGLNERRADRIEFLKLKGDLDVRFEAAKTQIIFGKDAVTISAVINSL